MNRIIASYSIWSELAKAEAGRRRVQKEREKRDEKKKAEAEEAQSDFMELAIPVVQATAEHIRAFTVQLDRYDAATIAALSQNSIELAIVRDRIEQMLLQAHVLEDGRRVFRTEDGTRVFDEHGSQVPGDIILPAEIDPRAPTWEAFSAERTMERELLSERQDLLEFQEKLDEARDEIVGGDISQDELEGLADELEDLMPTAVQRELGVVPIEIPSLKGSFSRVSMVEATTPKLNLPELDL